MTRTRRLVCLAGASALSLLAQDPDQAPRIRNALSESRAAQPSLEAAFRSIVNTQNDPAWIGYTVPSTPGEPEGCRGTTVFLEGPRQQVLLFRIEARQVDRVRAFPVDCQVDGGGLRLYWLTGVKPAESVALLDSLMNDSRDRIREQAASALARAEDPSAVNVLLRAAQQDKSPRVRGQALTSVAQRAGGQIPESVIREAIEKDPDTEVKKKAVFALTQIPNGGGVPMLIDVAKNNRNAAVRKQAMFWLGQSKDARAVKFFDEILGAGR